MNETIQQLYERKSTRAFLKEPISQKEKDLIFEAALQAPSAGNMSLYSIVEISDPVLKEKLAILCDDQPFIVQAPLVLVFLADYQKWHTLFASHARIRQACVIRPYPQQAAPLFDPGYGIYEFLSQAF